MHFLSWWRCRLLEWDTFKKLFQSACADVFWYFVKILYFCVAHNKHAYLLAPEHDKRTNRLLNKIRYFDLTYHHRKSLIHENGEFRRTLLELYVNLKPHYTVLRICIKYLAWDALKLKSKPKLSGTFGGRALITCKSYLVCHALPVNSSVIPVTCLWKHFLVPGALWSAALRGPVAPVSIVACPTICFVNLLLLNITANITGETILLHLCMTMDITVLNLWFCDCHIPSLKVNYATYCTPCMPWIWAIKICYR